MKLPSMSEYDKYGGRNYSREEFWSTYKALRDQKPLNIGQVLRSGDSLVAPRVYAA